jgi:4-aminobutyrate aminotransferase-like enzyme
MTTADVLEADPPAFSEPELVALLRDQYGVEGAVRPLVSERDQNALVTDGEGLEWVLKISNVAEDRGVIEMEVAAVEHIGQADPTLPVPRPRPTRDGGLIGEMPGPGGVGTHLVRLIPRLPGVHPAPADLDPATLREVGVVVARLAAALRGFFHPAAGRVIAWDQKHLLSLADAVSLVEDAQRRALLARVLDRFATRVAPAFAGLRAQVIHNDATLDNLLLTDGSVTGIIDFGDMAHTALVLDVPATLQSLVRDRDDIFEVAAAFLAGYASVLPLEEAEAELLGDLLAGRMAQTILISERRTRRYPDNAYIHGWSEPAWVLLEQLERVGFDAAGRRLAAAARPAGVGRVPTDELIGRRHRVLGRALEPLSYRRPLHLVRGRGAWMEDADGRRYLDAYNNVPVVGHAHPRVVNAIARQAAALNTNTRYLHENVVALAERLTATMPDGLDTVMFVNSGSEANDLAWRLATTVTGGDAGIVTDWAYHGVTAAIADFSPSEWPGGERPPRVETYAAPNTFRGPYAEAADPSTVGREEVAAAVVRLEAAGRRPAALFMDATFTADGIFVPGPPVVAAIVTAARDGGALYVADEVQSGHGRTGDGLWGFAAWGITPDIVTLGKPMGNGHPVAAVITRTEIVDRFAAQTTFFSTFGGNPVACAAALAVLDVIEEEELVAYAATVGEHLRHALRSLATRHPVIGDVRGRGLMTGVELVTDPDSRAPAGALATRVRDAMAERGVLIGTSGRAGNTLKIRPPLCIGREEAELIVTTLDSVLGGMGS